MSPFYAEANFQNRYNNSLLLKINQDKSKPCPYQRDINCWFIGIIGNYF